MKFGFVFLFLFLSGCSIQSSPLVSYDFIDLSQVERISKFRSGYGHDFSYMGDEECRSMKHYFEIKDGIDARHVRYTAPVNGTVKDVRTQINDEGVQESQFRLVSTQGDLAFVFFHVELSEGISDGTKVKAGDVLGVIGHSKAHGEIAIEDQKNDRLVSWFEAMGSELEENYRARGATMENSVISREQRDADPLRCDSNTPDGRFVPLDESFESFQAWQQSGQNWVRLQ